MNIKQLVNIIEQTHVAFQQKAVTAINKYLTIRNWVIGYYIVEYEQHGEDRAKYGERLVRTLSQKFEEKQIKGLSFTNINLFRQFYLTYPQIVQTASELLQNADFQKNIPILHTLTAESAALDISKTSIDQTVSEQIEHGKNIWNSVSPELLFNRLSFSHFTELIKIDDPLKRTFYEIECIKGTWSVRELKRQIGSLLFERTGLSKNKKKLLELANEKNVKLNTQDIIRDPYVFEFLGLKQREVFSETEMEKALLDHLQEFLLELGKGFCFESRQKRIQIGSNYYYIDLVFYHRILKCHVLIDLKIAEMEHEHIGQLNTYLNYFRKNEMEEHDKPPVGILLCTGKEEALVQYATANMDNKLFVSKYKVALPTIKELKAFIEQDKALLEEKINELIKS